ncbi:MAG: hypothetical protein IJO19_00450 [Clostridia bacterium]|nr:hypothetical protein [Clostridia bacterium]
MAKDLIEEIRNSELQAESIIETAEKKAEDLIESAKRSGEEFKKSEKENAEKTANTQIATADNNAYKVKTKAFVENSALAEQLKSTAEKNLDKAVDMIIKEIIPE